MNLTFVTRQLTLNHTFAVANSSKKSVENTFVRIQSDDYVGYGEAAPSYFYHENTASIRRVLETAIPMLQHFQASIQLMMDQIGEAIPGNFAAKTGIELALLDLVAKRKMVSIRELFGIKNDRSLTTSFTIGIDNLDVIKAKVIAAKDYPILKVKLGTREDYEIIKAIRSITDKKLRIDANEGWTKEEAVEKINWLETQNVELIEQPLPADEIANTAWIRERVNLPLFADESVKRSGDIEPLAEAFDGINIKLMKCGGVHEAVNMAKTARRFHLSTMLGCFIESSLAITAAAHIAPLFDYIDLDGALLLKNDPFAGVTFANGQFTLPDKYGIGAEPLVDMGW
ncbi:MAG: dipeptide epimerase [Candidatus Zhuqueibacterota bacterium]